MDVTNKILETLGLLFPDVPDQYRNNLRQGFNENSFFVKQVSVNNEQMLANRSIRSYNYQLHYFPENNPIDQEQRLEEQCEKMAERMYNQFLYLNNHEGKVLKPYHRIEDGVLLFQFNLKFEIEHSPDHTPMQSFEERSGLKGDS
ncbi:hypothetical protein SAMN04488134_101778 [Amphibacillus marinus]|uniref:Uncharacterized protein n=1 Tax=Amphibacillus marinus TaxID=872970 RepID=A0A1H8IZ85_9BACI|nr:hypothetical protein [Amphibacillus marinus]SEN73761.1 hypothetical protein SAMN04488134_101778 [Amphibacillus marinus]